MITTVGTRKGDIPLHQITWLASEPSQTSDGWFFDASIPNENVQIGPWKTDVLARAWRVAHFTRTW